ncbi:MAG: exo-alpha-sialidase [Ruminococcaceae bacterium]|nr:exo-alpha-sialidase [Oscillospiraceae bacterium]
MTEQRTKQFKKVGREVLFLSTGENNPRNGEGAFLRRKDGSVLHIYTAYFGDDGDDHATADLCGRISSDEGESWSDEFVAVKMGKDAKNVMSVSLLRMENGDIGLFYIEKLAYGDNKVIDRYCLVRSEDEGISFGDPTYCIDEGDYYVINNDRVVRLRSGKIVIPAARHPVHEREGEGIGRANFFVSDDDGRSFRKTSCELVTPFPEVSKGLQEPGIYQLPSGRIWAYFRTNFGCQFESFSDDECESFTPVRPNLKFPSPRSPMLVKDVGKYTVAIYNPVPPHGLNPHPFGMDRTPFMLAVSEDGGLNFIRHYLIEDDPDNSYCYPAVIEGEDYFLVSYYHSAGTDNFLNCEKVVKIGFDEIAE